jgi:transposase InsO family protein
MKTHRDSYPVTVMARVLMVTRSGFYAWLCRGMTNREQEDNRLKPLIQKAHKHSRGTYGALRIKAELDSQNIRVGLERIRRLRKELCLECRQRRKFKATTTSQHDLPVAPNLLDQQFASVEPGKVWGTDITYIATNEGWLYLAGVKDFCSKEIVGFAMGERMTKELVIEALEKALRFRKPRSGCIHHSDRGSQYCSHEYRRLLKASGLAASMSRKGNCYDNAPTESFWGCLKQELVYHRRFTTRAEATAAIQEYIAIFYNRIRRHSALGNIPPSIFAESFLITRKSA